MENDGNLRQSHLIPYPRGIKSAYPRGKVRKAGRPYHSTWSTSTVDLCGNLEIQKFWINCHICHRSTTWTKLVCFFAFTASARKAITFNTLHGTSSTQEGSRFRCRWAEKKSTWDDSFSPFTNHLQNHLLTIIYVIYTLSQSVLVLFFKSRGGFFSHPKPPGTLSDKASLDGWNSTGDQNSEQIAGW